MTNNMTFSINIKGPKAVKSANIESLAMLTEANCVSRRLLARTHANSYID